MINNFRKRPFPLSKLSIVALPCYELAKIGSVAILLN
jgi:hypothetical protein